MAATTAKKITIIGVDNSQWIVSGEGSGTEGVILDDNPGGLDDEAPIKTLWSQSVYQDGATYDGYVVEPLDLVLTFFIFGDKDFNRSWSDTNSQFRKAMDTSMGGEVQIVVETDSGERTLFVRKYQATRSTNKKDPHLLKYSKATFTMRAEVPFWLGETVVSTVQTSTATMTANVTVSNPTDRPIWLEWAVTSPGKWILPDYNFAGGPYAFRKIALPELSAGQDMTIDTHPLHETYIAADGHNIAGRFGGVDFLHPIPPHTPNTLLPVQVSNGSGTSICQVRMKQYWNLPYGGE